MTANAPAHERDIARLRGEHAGCRVLLAEDNPISAAVALELLRAPGLVVQRVDDGEQAVAAARAGAFDLVLMDLRMPGLDGLAATRALRAAGVATPIVAMTADADAPQRAACLQAGMNDLLAKPVDPQALFALLGAWLPAAPAGGDAVLMAQLEGVDGLDPAVALAAVGGQPEALERVLGRFVANYRDGLAGLRDGSTPELRRARRRAVHGLRGVAATLGAVSLHDVLLACEEADDAGRDSAELDALAQQAEAELRALVDRLDAVLRPRGD